MSNLKKFIFDRLSIISVCIVINVILLAFSLYKALIVWTLALILTIFFAEIELPLLLFERRKEPIKTRMKTLDFLGGKRAVFVRHESYYLWWRFEGEDGKHITLLDPTIIEKKSLTERIKELKDKQFIVQYYKRSRLIVSLEEIIENSLND